MINIVNFHYSSSPLLFLFFHGFHLPFYCVALTSMASDNRGTYFLSSWWICCISGTFCSLGYNSYFFYPSLPYTFHKYSCKPILKWETLEDSDLRFKVFRLRLTWLSQSFFIVNNILKGRNLFGKNMHYR